MIFKFEEKDKYVVYRKVLLVKPRKSNEVYEIHEEAVYCYHGEWFNLRSFAARFRLHQPILRRVQLVASHVDALAERCGWNQTTRDNVTDQLRQKWEVTAL